MNNNLIACCGLDCEKCDARIATVTNDTALREKTAALWSQLNGAEITPEMLHCTGCRVEGAKRRSATSSVPSAAASGKRGWTPAPAARSWLPVRRWGASRTETRRRWKTYRTCL